jgi:predicted ATPase
MHLLEREPLLSALQDALATAQTGAGRMVLVGGEAGIGKSALVTVFARQQAQAVRLLWGACDALFSPRPLGPLYEIAEQLGGEWPARLEASEKPTDLFGALQVELNRRPTLVVIEDAHWADEATLDLLRFLARRMTRTHALIVITYRDDELPPGHPLRAMLGDLATVSGIIRLAPSRLSLVAIRELAGPAVDAEALHARTLGNPFYVTEVLADSTGQLPGSVRDAVLSRIARLSLSGQAVVQAVAVIGPRAEAQVLSAVAGADVAALGECLHAGVLIASETGLSFRHDIVRQAVLESIAPTQRLALHRLTLQALRTAPGLNRNLARLAHHAEAAADPAAILTFAPAAALVARDAGAHRAAAALLELALAHAEDAPPGERAELLERLATEYDTLDRRPEAINLRRRALEAWRRADQPHKLGHSLAKFALLLQITGHKDEAERANHEALQILEPLPPTPELLLAYNMAAWLSLGANDNARGAAQAEKGIRLAEALGEEGELPRLLEVAGLCCLYLDLERGLA